MDPLVPFLLVLILLTFALMGFGKQPRSDRVVMVVVCTTFALYVLIT